MTREKVIEVIETYRGMFVRMNIGKADYPHRRILTSMVPALEHCHGMLDQMVEFVQKGEADQDKMEKVFRWLGFIQGVLWSFGIYPLETLKDQNREA